ncbi:glycosyltransferase [Commensalibacter oyaizuii]|uniref:Glycosyltransferase n=1 Tax=Commensalibacter oyaizuii TaxID=3043873 RepID=A0ABT6Q1Z4_9PROT|nr:glycosyltransferase [Commensalibacter sp. TBRC 16381]MDI2091104.1 glycosyltransferase [Commensalibacter sp. TBRC 16381]
MYTIQNLVFPKTSINAPKGLYYMTENGIAYPDKDEVSLIIPKNTITSLGTYFNYFSLRTWHSYCDLKDLSFKIEGSGEFILTLYISKLEVASEVILEEHISLNQSEAHVKIPYEKLDNGILFFKITTKTDCTIQSGCFYTKSKPLNDVKLGIVITHFNRKQYVLPAIERIRSQLLSHSEFKDHIELIVVDNSKNITAEESKGVTVIPNENYGGSGGFTRGLLHLKDNGFTHCLFMDDDASCEIESIIKTFRLLQYSKTPKLAISGSMLYEEHPEILHEKGAVFKELVFRPLYHGLNMMDFHHLQITDLGFEKPDYGAWWLFAFNISDVKNYPFPFFVKGDDMLFSFMNDFNIITVNGIAVWGENFSYKDGPFAKYLSIRANYVICLLATHTPLKKYIKNYLNLIKLALFSFNYDSARATSLGLKDVMEGPDFWSRNMSFASISKRVSHLTFEEKMKKLDMSGLGLKFLPFHESKLNRVIRMLTLNSFLLPKFLIKSDIVYNNKAFHGVFRQLFRAKQVVYYSNRYDTGYIARYDRKRFFEELAYSFKIMYQFIRCFHVLKKQYRKVAPKFMTEQFWRNVYKDTKK